MNQITLNEAYDLFNVQGIIRYVNLHYKHTFWKTHFTRHC